MKHLLKCAIVVIGITMLTTGCQCPFMDSNHQEVYIARYAEKPITNESFLAAAKLIDPEKAKVKFLWDKKKLYFYFYFPPKYHLTHSQKNKNKGDLFQFYIRAGGYKYISGVNAPYILGISTPYQDQEKDKTKDKGKPGTCSGPILLKELEIYGNKIEPGAEVDVIVHFLKDGESPCKCTAKDNCWSKLKFVK